MDQETITIRLQCDPADGLRMLVYTQDSKGLAVEHVDVSTTAEVNTVWYQAKK